MSDKKMGMDKRFLSNNPHETGYVCWGVSVNHHYGNNYYLDCDLKLADCMDNISLEFSAGNVKQANKRIEKMDTLITSLKKLRGTLIEARDYMVRVEASD